ncbi:hypothetical protein BLOT_007510 [Blomia tropicalis]|nr:hypothetical protein BLOT_007510 [Blomia tropicalis]
MSNQKSETIVAAAVVAAAATDQSNNRQHQRQNHQTRKRLRTYQSTMILPRTISSRMNIPSFDSMVRTSRDQLI